MPARSPVASVHPAYRCADLALEVVRMAWRAAVRVQGMPISPQRLSRLALASLLPRVRFAPLRSVSIHFYALRPHALFPLASLPPFPRTFQP